MHSRLALVLWTGLSVFQVAVSIVGMVIALIQRNVLLMNLLSRHWWFASGTLGLSALLWLPGDLTQEFAVLTLLLSGVGITAALGLLTGWRRRPAARLIAGGVRLMGWFGAILGLLAFALPSVPVQQQIFVGQVWILVLLAGFVTVLVLTKPAGSLSFWHGAAVPVAVGAMGALVFFPGSAPSLPAFVWMQLALFVLFASRLTRPSRQVIGTRTDLMSLFWNFGVWGTAVLPLAAIDTLLPGPWHPLAGDSLLGVLAQSAFSALLLRRILPWVFHPSVPHQPRTPRDRRDPREDLSLRETQVAELLAEGLSYQAIADRLFISLKTVKSHARAVYSKMGVSNRMALIWLHRAKNLA